MADIEQEHWKKTIEDFDKNSKDVYDKLIKWAQKFGGLAESTKNELKNLNAKLNKPFWKTWDFWKTMLTIGVYLAGIALIIVSGGCFHIKGLVELGTCTNL